MRPLRPPLLLVLLPALLLALAGGLGATSNPIAVGLSLDQATQTAASGLLADEEVLYLLADGTEFRVLAGLGADLDLDAFHADFGGSIVSLKTHASIDGVFVAPGDVVQMTVGTPTVLFDASAAGLAEADVDAVSRHPSGDLLLSFTDTVPHSGGVAADEDVLRWDGASLTLFFDGSAAGVPESADVDGIHWDAVGNRLWMTFDTTVALGGLVADDEDVVAWEDGWGWERILDTSTRIPAGEASDADALWGESEFVDPLIFQDGFESGDTSAW